MLATLLSKRYGLAHAIFSCRATTSGNPFSAVGAAPLRFRILVSSFHAARRVLEEKEKDRSSCKHNILCWIHSVVLRRIQDSIAYSSPFLFLFLCQYIKVDAGKIDFASPREADARVCCGMKNLLTFLGSTFTRQILGGKHIDRNLWHRSRPSGRHQPHTADSNVRNHSHQPVLQE